MDTLIVVFTYLLTYFPAQFSEAVTPLGLRMWAKTKLQNLGAGPPPENISISDNDVESVDDFMYLGSLQPSDGQSRADMRRRISLAAATMSSLSRIWKDKRLLFATKICIYQGLILSVLLCASETWILLAADVRSLEAFYMKCQRQILGIRWFDRITNQAISNKTGLQPFASLIRNRRVAPFGHIARLPDNVPAHQALLTGINLSLGRRPSPDWRRPSGCPTNRGLDQIRIDTGSPPARNARGYHPGATQRSQLATRQ